MDADQAIESLQDGGVGILPTDTLYGIVTSAFLADSVERVYDLKQRDPTKPLIILISHVDEVEQFGVVLSDSLREQLASYWPGPYSIVLPVVDDQFEYISRGSDSIAFRIPDKEDLRELLQATGPLVAPSANPEGYPPATTALEAQRYFGSDVDFYVDGGTLDGNHSKLLRIENGEVEVIRD